MEINELKDVLSSTSVSWQHKCLQILEYHEQQVKNNPDKRGKKQGWTVHDTARDIGLSYSLIYWELQLGKKIRNNELQDARSKTHAIEMLKENGASKVVIKHAKTFLAGNLVTTVKFNGTDLCIIKLPKPLRTEHLDIDLLCIPRYLCSFIKD